MLVVALTGGIGSGKSAVAARFSQLGVPILDADELARDLVVPGAPALASLVETFGRQILLADGTLDRAALRHRVFQAPDARRQLEAILHPRIRTEMERWLARQTSPYAVLVIPLLVETGQMDLADRILLVDCPRELQIERVCRRDGQSCAQVEAILRAQADPVGRRAIATEIINNDGSLHNLITQTDHMHHHFLRLAEQHTC